MESPVRARETSVAEDVRELRQGDIFRWLPGDHSSQDPWKQLGMVVTADCDIAQEKHGKFLSYVPILNVHDYSRFFALPKMLLRPLRSKEQQLRASVRKLQATHSPSYSNPMSDEAIDEWLRGAGPEAVLSGLSVPAGKARSLACDLMDTVLVAWRALPSQDHDCLVEANMRIRGKKAREEILKELKNNLTQLPGDAFFLGGIEGVASTGFVVYLRLIRELEASAIAVRQSETRRAGVKAQRVASLRAPYLYGLIKSLADVFASVGLPSEYEIQRDDILEKMFLQGHAATGAPSESE